MPPDDSLLMMLLLGLIAVLGIVGIILLIVIRSVRRHRDAELWSSRRKKTSKRPYTDVWSESARRTQPPREEDDRE
ncbi:MAG: hypothetical protein ACOC1G_05450 [Phycisphaeraceae bacterium]